MLVGYCDEYRRALDTLTKYLALPAWQAAPAARNALNAIVNPDRPSNPLIGMLPDYPGVINRFAQADRSTAILVTVEALRNFAAAHANALPDSLDQLSPETPAPVDPLTGKPFSYQKTPDGATLSAPAPPNTGADIARTWTITVAR
jgi:hypothetical protein